MAIAYSFDAGFIAGIVLFVVLERAGVVYRWFDSLDRWSDQWGR